MFGKNQQLPMDPSDDRKLAVQEVFYTLQGEGPFAGRPAVFIRLAGCNLACTFCDTEFDSNISNRMVIGDIIEWAQCCLQDMGQSLKGVLAVVTGGEPLRQEATTLLCQALIGVGAQVQIETAGTCLHDSMLALLDTHPSMLTLVCSPKTPNVHHGIEEHCTHWKYVIRAGETDDQGLPMRGTQPNQFGRVVPLFRPPTARAAWWKNHIWLSPCDDYDEDKNQRNVKHATELALRHGYRLSLQMHKIVGLR